MYKHLKKINEKPTVFGEYTAKKLWNDPYTSKQMLSYHLNPDLALASRTHHFINQSVKWMQNFFSITKETSICDFGCGPGLYTSKFASISSDVSGVDFSESSIEYAKTYAKSNGLNITYHLANYLEFETDKKFDLITIVMCDFCVLSPKQRKKLLHIFINHLNENGRVVLDVYSMHAFHDRETKAIYEYNQLNGFWSNSDYYTFVNTFKYDEEKVLLDKYTVFEESGTEKVIYNWFQYFDNQSLSNEVNSSGFEIVEFFSDVAGGTYSNEQNEFAVVLKKI